MNSAQWAVPGDLDSCFWFGEQFYDVYDRIVPAGPLADQAADFLMRTAGGGRPSVIELGVGTGQVALRLARRGALVTGVDGSPSMLAVCRAAPGGADIRLVEADIRSWRPDQQADLVYCVAGTVTLLPTPEDRRRAMRVIASAVRPGGKVVIENHDPALVRSFHTERPVVELKMPVAGAPEYADVRSLFDEERGVLQMEYRWTEADGTVKEAAERVALTGPDELIGMAAEVGLTWSATYGDWTGTPGEMPLMKPTYVCVLDR